MTTTTTTTSTTTNDDDDDDDGTTFRRHVGFTQFEFANSSLSHLSSAATAVLNTWTSLTIIILSYYCLSYTSRSTFMGFVYATFYITRRNNNMYITIVSVEHNIIQVHTYLYVTCWWRQHYGDDNKTLRFGKRDIALFGQSGFGLYLQPVVVKSLPVGPA